AARGTRAFRKAQRTRRANHARRRFTSFDGGERPCTSTAKRAARVAERPDQLASRLGGAL
ncbi:MAG: hypothetical protein AVDCRST_MAG39-455, partial [uncultured Sphingomonadaceae bacterium]